MEARNQQSMTRQISKNDESLNISQDSASRGHKYTAGTQPLPNLVGQNKLKEKRSRRNSGISGRDSFDRRFDHSKIRFPWFS